MWHVGASHLTLVWPSRLNSSYVVIKCELAGVGSQAYCSHLAFALVRKPSIYHLLGEHTAKTGEEGVTILVFRVHEKGQFVRVNVEELSSLYSVDHLGRMAG